VNGAAQAEKTSLYHFVSEHLLVAMDSSLVAATTELFHGAQSFLRFEKDS